MPPPALIEGAGASSTERSSCQSRYHRWGFKPYSSASARSARQVRSVRSVRPSIYQTSARDVVLSPLSLNVAWHVDPSSYVATRPGGNYINSPCPVSVQTSPPMELILNPFQLRSAIPAAAFTLILWHYVTSRIRSHVRRPNGPFRHDPRYSRTSASQVSVPVIGPKLPGLAFISTIRALFKYDSMIEDGHRKVRGHHHSAISFLSLTLAPSFRTASSSYQW